MTALYVICANRVWLKFGTRQKREQDGPRCCQKPLVTPTGPRRRQKEPPSASDASRLYPNAVDASGRTGLHGTFAAANVPRYTRRAIAAAISGCI
jgi:hypothetical protein